MSEAMTSSEAISATTAAGVEAALDLDAAAVDRARRQILNPFLFRAYLLAKLPLGLIAGLRVRSLSPERCETTIPYGWRTTNPFRSMYFAAQSMAAELSTGAIALMAVELAPRPVAMLIVGLDAEFSKQADRRVTFTCEEGGKILAAVRETVATGEPATVRVETVGRMDDGTEVSRFTFHWSFKRRA